MAGPRQKRTVQGMGAVRNSRAPRTSGVDLSDEPRSGYAATAPDPAPPNPDDDPRPFGVRDTVPAPPLVSADEAETGARRRFTLEHFARPAPLPGSAPPVSAPPASAPPASAPPASTPARGRYSSQPVEHDDVSPNAPASSPSSRKSLRRSVRQPLRVDDVGATTIVATHDASRGSKPQIVDRKRIPDAPLTAREAFLLALVDGALTVEDLVDAAAMPEREVTAILTRLVRLGIVSF
jgi:hypothetical protein